MRLIVLLAAALLAGCATPSPEPAPQEDAPRVAAVTLDACAIVEAPATVPADAVRAHVPAGFEPALDDEGRAHAVLGAASCAQGSRAFLAIAVTPANDTLRADGVRHFFEPEHLVPPGGFADALAAMGLASPGARVEATAAPPRPGFTVEGEGWMHRAQGAGAAVAPVPEALVAGRFREWFAAPGGYGYLEASFGAEGASLGLVPMEAETGEGTTSREVLGASFSSQAFVLDRSAYAEATLGFVPFP